MEFLVEFEVEVPAGTPDAEVEQHQRAGSAAAAKLAEDGSAGGDTHHGGNGRSVCCQYQIAVHQYQYATLLPLRYCRTDKRPWRAEP
jgi:hypothetical protein